MDVLPQGGTASLSWEDRTLRSTPLTHCIKSISLRTVSFSKSACYEYSQSDCQSRCYRKSGVKKEKLTDKLVPQAISLLQLRRRDDQTVDEGQKHGPACFIYYSFCSAESQPINKTAPFVFALCWNYFGFMQAHRLYLELGELQVPISSCTKSEL